MNARNKKPFSDRYVFAKVMQDNPDLCRELIERVLGVKVSNIKAIETESGVPTIERRSVRYDVFLDSEEAAFEVEMQTYAQHDLPLRMRYYRSLMDRRLLDRGDPFDELKPVYVIFICWHDYFGLGLPVYTFTNTCQEDPRARFDDRAVNVVLSASGDLSKTSGEIAGLLQYVLTGNPAGDGFAERLQGAVDKAYDDEEWVNTMMPLEWDIRDAERAAAAEGMAKGMAKGVAEGMAEGMAKGMAEGVAKGESASDAQWRQLMTAMRDAGLTSDAILEALAQGDRAALCEQYGIS